MSIRDLQQAVRAAQRTIQAWEKSNTDPLEERTRSELIDPVLKALGWPVNYGQRSRRNRKPCITEYYPYEDFAYRVDYAMFDNHGKEVIIIEAKHFLEHTKDHYLQLADYCDDARNMKAVLTNGEYWNVVVFDQRGIVHEENPISIMWDNSGETVDHLYRLLSREHNRVNPNSSVTWKR